jgi:asparagine synthase (glutamine-hydrolysing)
MPDESLINKIPNYSAKQNYNYHQTGIKKMIVDLGKGILPENLDKQSKKGFQMPFSDWLKKDFTDIIDEITDPVSIKRRGLFNSSEIQHIKKAFFEGKESWTKLWLIMVIELWCREFID